MKNKIKLVGVTLMVAVLFATPVAAIVAGIFALATSLSFWPTFAYALIGTAVFNLCSIVYRGRKLFCC